MKPLQKTIDRNLQIIADYEKVPRESMASIGRRYGVTRAYIHQIVTKHYAGRKND